MSLFSTNWLRWRHARLVRSPVLESIALTELRMRCDENRRRIAQAVVLHEIADGVCPASRERLIELLRHTMRLARATGSDDRMLLGMGYTNAAASAPRRS